MRYKLTDPSVIKALAEEFGFKFTKSLGQNFIVSQSVVDRMADACGADAAAGVLEIGPGAGTLTQALAERAGTVVAIEIDSSLIPLLNKTLEDHPNVRIINADALRLDFKAFCHEYFTQEKIVVCANLPYYITTQLVTAMLEACVFTSLTVMMQKEAAERLCSSPGDPNYCAAAAEIGYFAESKTLFRIPAECYVPRPTVGSVVIKLNIRPARLDAGREKLLLRIINAAFSQRRKTLVNTLSNSALCTRAEAETAIKNCGFPATVRGEALSPEDFIRLTEDLSYDKDNI